MSGEDEVPAVDLRAAEGEAAARRDLDDARHQLREGDRVVQLRGAGVAGVRLGQGRDVHGDRSVEVEQAQDDEDSAEDDHAVAVEEDSEARQHHVGHDEVLGHPQPPVLVLDVVQDDVRQRRVGRHPLVHQRDAEGRGEGAAAHEHGAQQRLEDVVRDVDGFLPRDVRQLGHLHLDVLRVPVLAQQRPAVLAAILQLSAAPPARANRPVTHREPCHI